MEKTMAPRAPKKPIREARYTPGIDILNTDDELTHDDANKRRWGGLRKSKAASTLKGSEDSGPITDGPLAGYHIHTQTSGTVSNMDTVIALVNPSNQQIDMVMRITKTGAYLNRFLEGLSRRKGINLDPYDFIKAFVIHCEEELTIYKLNDETTDMVRKFIIDPDIHVYYDETDEEITDPEFLEVGKNLIPYNDYWDKEEKAGSRFNPLKRKEREAFKQTEKSFHSSFTITSRWG